MKDLWPNNEKIKLANESFVLLLEQQKQYFNQNQYHFWR